MNRNLFFPESDQTTTPKILWLKLTGLALNCALGLFRASHRLRTIRLLDWVAVQILRLACRALGHAPAEVHLEFRADLPVCI